MFCDTLHFHLRRGEFYVSPTNASSFVLLFTYFNKLLLSVSIILITLIKSLGIEHYQLSDLFFFLFIAHANYNSWQEAVARMLFALV